MSLQGEMIAARAGVTGDEKASRSMTKKDKLFAPQHTRAARAFVKQVTSPTTTRANPHIHARLCARLRRVAHGIQFVVLAIAIGTVTTVFSGAAQNAAWTSAVMSVGLTTGLAVLISGIALRNLAWYLDPEDDALDADHDDATLMRATDRTYAFLSWPFFPVIFVAVCLRERSVAAHASARGK